MGLLVDHQVDAGVAGWGLEEAVATTELIVSEPVTNAVRYAGPPVRLRLILQGTGLIGEVSDNSSTSPHLRWARTFDESGRGLLIVAQLTRSWGTRHHADGKTMWAEQHLETPRTTPLPTVTAHRRTPAHEVAVRLTPSAQWSSNMWGTVAARPRSRRV
ncbi:hypothetical protein SHL15_7341 [Streptomyces hygroscopicus subsp. limoneus]|nr:hypothetical protein SHL15_7341 [Streptomyces hygroscopicus subsp. limoneus]